MGRKKKVIEQDEVELINKAPSLLGSNNYVVQINKHHPIYIDKSPFGNCQNFSIKYFDRLPKAVKHIDNILKTLFMIKKVTGTYKASAVIDVRREVYEKIKRKVKFVSKNFYKSTNGSSMVMCVIDLRPSTYNLTTTEAYEENNIPF